MPFSGKPYDAKTLDAMTRVLGEALGHLTAGQLALDTAACRSTMALSIMDGIDGGVHDVDVLRRIAVAAVDGRG